MQNQVVISINHSQIVHETIDGETIILNMDSGSYFSLNNSGTAVWESISSGVSLNEIDKELQRIYPNTETVKNDLDDFIEKLLAEALLSKNANTEENGSDFSKKPESLLHNLSRDSYEKPAFEKYTDMQDILQLDPIHEVDEAAGWPVAKIQPEHA